MQYDNGLTPAERELEAALASLRPSTSGCESAGLMYRAGLEAGRRRVRIWQGAAALLAMVLSASLLYQSVSAPAASIVESREFAVEQQPSSPRAAAVDVLHLPESDRPVREAAYLKLRNRVLEYGLDMLPEVKAAAKAGGGTVRPENLGGIITNYSLNGED